MNFCIMLIGEYVCVCVCVTIRRTVTMASFESSDPATPMPQFPTTAAVRPNQQQFGMQVGNTREAEGVSALPSCDRLSILYLTQLVFHSHSASIGSKVGILTSLPHKVSNLFLH